MNAKIKQMSKYKPTKKFIKYFNDVANGYSHTFRYDEKNDKIYFSALTHNCGCIQIYADSTKQMEQEFINAVQRKLNEQCEKDGGRDYIPGGYCGKIIIT